MTPVFEPLLLYRRFSDSKLARLVAELHDDPARASANDAYALAFSMLAAEESAGADPWRHFVRRAVLSEETAFSRSARTVDGPPAAALARALRHDLRIMERLHAIDGDELARTLSAADGHLPSWSGLGSGAIRATGMEQALANTRGWDSLVDVLWKHFRAHSPEPFDRFVAFRWRSPGLQPVTEPDPVRLDDLIGYERERELLIRNTEMLVAGRQANNVLLYGPRGTGKSSTVKALINEYKDGGLRLVQVERPDLNDFPDIVAELRHRPERFIVFLDDLAFELRENEYAHLKGLLEGGLETRPVNVAVYATSNRRHLVEERFSDREEAQDVVHVTDTYQHKLSLADRFGVRILLPAADQSVYLAIVEGLAQKRGLTLPVADLHRQSLRWSATHNGLSPRTAQQFVDHLEGSAVLEPDAPET